MSKTGLIAFLLFFCDLMCVGMFPQSFQRVNVFQRLNIKVSISLNQRHDLRLGNSFLSFKGLNQHCLSRVIFPGQFTEHLSHRHQL